MSVGLTPASTNGFPFTNSNSICQASLMLGLTLLLKRLIDHPSNLDQISGVLPEPSNLCRGLVTTTSTVRPSPDFQVIISPTLAFFQ